MATITVTTVNTMEEDTPLPFQLVVDLPSTIIHLSFGRELSEEEITRVVENLASVEKKKRRKKEYGSIHKLKGPDRPSQSEQKECNICMERESWVTFGNCCHQTCLTCAQKMSTCPFCRSDMGEISSTSSLSS